MGVASAQTTVEGVSVAEAEQLWYDVDSWPLFIDGLRSIESVVGDPPLAGSKVVWDSTPAGRGRVSETVIDYAPGVGQELEVEDRSIRGRQRVRFSAEQGPLRIQLELNYQLTGSNPFRSIIDWLFIRRAQTESLQRTLTAFRLELGAQPDEAGGASER